MLTLSSLYHSISISLELTSAGGFLKLIQQSDCVWVRQDINWTPNLFIGRKNGNCKRNVGLLSWYRTKYFISDICAAYNWGDRRLYLSQFYPCVSGMTLLSPALLPIYWALPRCLAWLGDPAASSDFCDRRETGVTTVTSRVAIITRDPCVPVTSHTQSVTDIQNLIIILYCIYNTLPFMLG